MKFFSLQYSWYEDDRTWFFSGSDDKTHQSFQTACNELIPEAARQCVIDNPNNYIGWQEIAQQVSILLPLEGFTLIEPMMAKIAGPTIIKSRNDYDKDRLDLLGAMKDIVLEHNRKIEDSPNE